MRRDKETLYVCVCLLCVRLEKSSLLAFRVVHKSVLDPLNGGSADRRHCYPRSVWLQLVPALRRQGEVQRPRDDQPEDDHEGGDMCNGKGVDLKWVVTLLVEERIGEANDDGENGRGDVFNQRGPEDRDIPVFAHPDDDIQIACQLIALFMRY